MKLTGKKVTLVPITGSQKDEFYELATKSYGSKYWYDSEDENGKIKKKFFQDWSDGYFDINLPYDGQCFWIQINGKNCGQVNYNAIDRHNKRTELDVIIGPKEYLGKGYGSDALDTLIEYLFNNFNLNKVWIEARSNNSRAINAYQKVGFIKEGLLRKHDYFNGSFVDCVRFGLLRSDHENKQRSK